MVENKGFADYKIYIFDYNLTLETGSEIALTEAINRVRDRHGLTDPIEVAQVLKLYGASLEDFVAAFFPAGLDVGLVLSELKSELPALDKKYIRAREDAVDLLKFIQKQDNDVAVVVSASPGERDFYLESVGLEDYITDTYFLSDWLDLQNLFVYEGCSAPKPLSRAIELFKALMIASFSKYRTAYNPTDLIYIGDSAVDVIAAHITNKIFDWSERKYRELLGFEVFERRVISVLLDPEGDKTIIIPDDMTKGMRELMEYIEDGRFEPCVGPGWIEEFTPSKITRRPIEPDYRVRDLRELIGIFYLDAKVLHPSTNSQH